MSDFSALCPLFNTGVYSELTIPGPLLQDNLASTTTKLAGILFGRSVIVTAAYLSKMTTLATVSSNPTVKLYRQASWASSTATCFASFEISKTITTQICNKYLQFTQAAAKTFSASQWLTVRGDKGRENGKSIHGIIVRYKEK